MTERMLEEQDSWRKACEMAQDNVDYLWHENELLRAELNRLKESVDYLKGVIRDMVRNQNRLEVLADL